jgi:hypothetical protein
MGSSPSDVALTRRVRGPLSKTLRQRSAPARTAKTPTAAERQSSAAAALAELNDSETQNGPRSGCSDWFGGDCINHGSSAAIRLKLCPRRDELRYSCKLRVGVVKLSERNLRVVVAV